jgi:hypothetical protein
VVVCYGEEVDDAETGFAPDRLGVAVGEAHSAGGERHSCTPSVDSISVSPVEASLEVGQTRTCVANVVVDGDVNQVATGSGGDTGVVSVHDAGVATAITAGSATISAIRVPDPRIQGTATVKAKGVAGIAFSPSDLALQPTEAQQLPLVAASVMGADAQVVYSSSASDILSVSDTGLATAGQRLDGVIRSVDVTSTATLVAKPSVSDTITVRIDRFALPPIGAGVVFVYAGSTDAGAAGTRSSPELCAWRRERSRKR